MATALRQPSPVRFSPLLLCAGLFSTVSLEAPLMREDGVPGPYATLDPPTLEARLGHGRLRLITTTESRSHEAEIYDLLAEHFAIPDIDALLHPGVVVPDSWRKLTLELLRVAATLESANISIGPSSISIRGVTASPATYAARIVGLRAELPSTISIDERVTKVAHDLPLRKLCEKTFPAFSSRAIEFERASAALRTSAHALLDRLIEFAWDCRDVGIRVTGHSDAAGDENWNLDLSRRRAEAVAEYLVSGGIERERLYIDGQGSAAPIADNGTAYGRRLNRRIEFSLLR